MEATAMTVILAVGEGRTPALAPAAQMVVAQETELESESELATATTIATMLPLVLAMALARVNRQKKTAGLVPIGLEEDEEAEVAAGYMTVMILKVAVVAVVDRARAVGAAVGGGAAAVAARP